ncbi:MAG: ABC transporter substrate-binding protein [bacterium]|nr:ABC transporter substrate-binding protein [bacterium]
MSEGKPELSTIELYGVSDPNISGQLILAKEMGFFQDEGLDVSYRLLSSGTIMPEEVMNAKEKPFALTQTPITTLVLKEKGVDVKIVAPLADISGTQQIVVRENANIRKPEDLQGKRIGMAKGAAVRIAIQGMAKEFGLDLNSVEFVHLMPPQQLEAMEKGDIEAIACWEPWTSKAQAVGGKFLFSGARSEIPDNEGDINWLVDQSVLMTFPEHCEQYPETIKALIRAFRTATRFINRNSEKAAEILSSPLAIGKEELLHIISLNKYSMTMDNLFKIGLLSFRELLHQNGVISITPPEGELYSTTFLKDVDPELVLIEEELEEEDEDEELQEYLTIFFDEVDEIIRKLDNDTVDLENVPDDKVKLRAITGAFHTLKGNAGFLGFDKIMNASKHIEGYLKALKLEEGEELGKSIISLIYYATDVLKTLVADYKESNSSNFDISGIQQRISQISPEMEETVVEVDVSGEIEISGYEALKLREAKKKGKTIYQIDAQFETDWTMRSAGTFIVVRKLGLSGEVVKVAPPLGSKELKGSSEVHILYVTEIEKSRILDVSKVAVVVSSIEVKPFNLPEVLVVQRDETNYLDEFTRGDEFTLGSKAKSRTLRVDYKKLDDIMNIIGELIIGGSTLARGLTETRDALALAQQPIKMMEPIQKISEAIRKNLLNLQENIMKVRMTPIDVVFRKFPRVVRELALKSGKDVKLEVIGEETDLDKTLVDVIDRPIFHLIRHTIDHGIEPPMVREQLGKPQKGTIQLISFREGNQIVIIIEDDGRGFDLEKMKRHAYETGSLPAEKLQKLSRIDAFNLLFISQSSSGAEGATGEQSGMEIVRDTVSNLKGTVELESRLGEGSIFTIKLPLTLAIIQALVFGVGKWMFALPLSMVVEAIRISPSQISYVGDREVFELRNQVVNLLRPHALLDIPLPPQSANKKIHVIVVRSSERKLIGILADRLMEKEELVIKSLENKIMRSEITSSASKLGDGKVVLILDVPALIRSAFG